MHVEVVPFKLEAQKIRNQLPREQRVGGHGVGAAHDPTRLRQKADAFSASPPSQARGLASAKKTEGHEAVVALWKPSGQRRLQTPTFQRCEKRKNLKAVSCAQRQAPVPVDQQESGSPLEQCFA